MQTISKHFPALRLWQPFAKLRSSSTCGKRKKHEWELDNFANVHKNWIHRNRNRIANRTNQPIMLNYGLQHSIMGSVFSESNSNIVLLEFAGMAPPASFLAMYLSMYIYNTHPAIELGSAHRMHCGGVRWLKFFRRFSLYLFSFSLISLCFIWIFSLRNESGN